LEERLPLESHLAVEHVIDGPGQLMGQHGQGVAFVMCFLQTGEVWLRWRMVSQKQDRGFRKGPFEVGIAALGARGAQAFAGGFLGPFDQTALGGKILYPGEAVDIMDFVAQHEAEDVADAGHGLQQIQGVGVMMFGGVDEGAFDVAKQLIVVGDAHEIHCDALVHRRIGKALGDPVTVGLVGDLFTDRRQIILAVDILDVCQEFGPFVGQMHPAPEQVAGGPQAAG
jgi:hypothetical protein